MNPATQGRRVALDGMRAVRRGRRLDIVWNERASDLDSRQRAWTHELLYGTVRLRGRLDHLLERKVHQGLSRLEPDVLDLLRLGAYQVLEMGSVPPYAAISQSVELAREEIGHRVSGLVNAVLRAVSRDGADDGHFPDFSRDPVAFLSTWGSHPRWLVRRWVERYGPEGTRALVESNNTIPPVFLNPLDLSPEQARVRLAEAGIPSEVEEGDSGTLRLGRHVDPADAVEEIPAVIQDPAAAWVCRYAAPAPGSVIADLCAAPGGKALVLSRRARWVVAGDRSEVRVRLLRENVSRTGRRQVQPIVASALRPPLEAVDGVILDVPCSGTGTLRRHPDARWRVTQTDITSLARLQARMLDAVAPAVRSGGLLVYATCTLEPEENEIQVREFLARNEDFSMEPGPADGRLDAGGCLRLEPHRFPGLDGAFAARMRKTA